MEQDVKVHLQGFFDPLEGRITLKDPASAKGKLFGHTVAARVRAESMGIVINHEEQFEGPLSRYEVTLKDREASRKIAEMFREERKAEISFSTDGREIKIRY
jgi:hypothetical protein